MNKVQLAQNTLALGALVAATVSANADLILSVEVGYGFGGASSSGLYAGSPDTGFVTIVNTGTTTFTGELSVDAPGLFGSFFDTSGPGHVMAPGDSWTLLPGPESSNFGGYFKNQPGTDPAGLADDGALLKIVGDDGSCFIDFSIHDKDIHSGVFAVNPFGVTLDNYILQGGDPFGRDTGDAFEVAQGHAFFDITCVPEPSQWAMIGGMGLLGFGVWRKRNAR
jgi:hypothetical protein